MPPTPEPRIEELLAHAGWVRELAGRLTADSAEADDLVQKTWVTALRRPPSSRENLRGWLARVLRNLASRSRRAEARRLHREERAARPEAQPSVTVLHERAQAHRDLVEAVLGLEEPYSSTVLLRYFEGLPPRIIAARQGLPVNTVRARLSRGLDMLRARLRRTYGTERGWAPALCPLALEPYWKAHLGLGVLLMTTKVKISVVAAVAVIVVAALWTGASRALSPADDDRPTSAQSTALDEPAEPPQGSTPGLASDPPHSANLQRRTQAAPVGPGQPAPALVFGLLLLPGGDPAAGARLTLRRAARTGNPGADGPVRWEDLTVDADDAGRFEFSFSPPRAHQVEAFSLDASYPGHVPLAWEMIVIQAGSRRDLGTGTFAAPGRIVGRILGPSGEAQVDGWRVQAEAPGPGGGIRDETRTWGRVDPSTLEFRLEGVPAGTVMVSASHPMGARLEQVPVVVRPWEETHLTLFHEGPDLARRVTVRIGVPRVVLGVLEGSMLRLEDGAGQVLVPTRVEDRTNLFVFDGLADGSYTAAIDDPRFEPWSRAGVRPGEYVEARLVGSAAVRLRVVDARTGESVSGAEVWGDLHDSGRSRTRFDLPAGRPLDDGSVAYVGLVPTSFSLVARAPGYPEARAAVEDLAAGEERPVTLRLVPTPPLVGRVVRSDGHTPASGVQVQRTLGREPGWTTTGPVHSGGGTIPPIDEVVTTDAQGAFRFEGVPAARHALRAVQGRWLAVSRVVEWPDAAGQELLLVLPPCGRLEGRILVPPEGRVGELVIRLDFRDHPEAHRLSFLPGQQVQAGELSGDGSFGIGPLPTGVLRLSYRRGDDLGSQVSTGASFELGEVTIRAGETTRVEFDERERFPGLLRIRVHLNGEVQSSGMVKVQQGRIGAARTLDSREEIVFDDATPGPWHVGFADPDGRWSYRSPDTWLVRPGETTDVELHVFLHTRSLSFVDPTSGAPLAGVEVAWRMVRPVHAGTMLGTSGGSTVTDDQGSATLTLPPGELRFYRGSPSEWDAPHAEVQWTAEAGALRVELPGG